MEAKLGGASKSIRVFGAAKAELAARRLQTAMEVSFMAGMSWLAPRTARLD
jgi:hypothetical protein